MGVDRLLREASEVGGTVRNRGEDERREAGLAEPVDAVFGLGFVPVDEEDGAHQCRLANGQWRHECPHGAVAVFGNGSLHTGQKNSFIANCRIRGSNAACTCPYVEELIFVLIVVKLG